MTAPVANCASCGAEVRFQWAGAVQTVCTHCGSVLVRRGVDLAHVGRVSEPPPATSRIQLGTRGVYDGTAFRVVGRIAYEYERGFWSEWHLGFADGRSGWLSDAQDEYAVSFLAEPARHTPDPAALRPGAPFNVRGTQYVVSSLTRARYSGVEGELPFEYWNRAEVLFVDLGGAEGSFGTLDFSEDPPLVFLGRYVPFQELALRDLREPEERRAEGADALNCPNCGGTVTIRLPGETVNAVCQYCQSVLNARSPKLAVLQRFQDRVAVRPMIPLGSTGRLHGADWTALGFQQVSIKVEGVTYSWREYLLHAPERGFRYLTEYDGHWNDVVPLKEAPQVTGRGQQARVQHRGQWFRHFQRANAETSFVLGEFPWQVRVGDRMQSDDYVHPPLLLSREQTRDEVTWSVGEYVPPARIWEAFRLEGSPPRPRGVFANQPSPHPPAAPMWLAYLAFAAALLVLLLVRSASTREVYSGDGTFALADSAAQNVLVTEPFTISGRPSRLRVKVDTDVSNASAYFDMTLVNEQTGRTREFDAEASYYYGYDAGERWSEGSSRDGASVPRVEPGRYRLVVAPQATTDVRYSIRAVHGGPAVSLYLLALLALLVPPLARLLMGATFEHGRWMESDYPPTSGNDD
ncbi:DUF4178 domain-containing protein [Longimicrobium sp.]|uniref:DUF4178 domain-containing protein n=1 Tax=Longimicrobium sp. TaxID=2029185 RepID=UPI003B3A9B1A